MSAMTSEGVIEDFANSGFPITLKSAEEFGKYIKDDYNNIESMKDILSK